MKTVNNDIDLILKSTKNLVKSSENFYNYYNKNDNSLIKTQISLLTEPSNFKSFIPNKLNKNNSKTKLKKQIPFPLKNIRKENMKSNKIPKLCPFYNNKNELIPSIISSSKIDIRNNSLNNTSYFSKTLGCIPIKLKKSASLNKINEINNYEEIYKEFFNDCDYSNLKYDEKEIFFNHKKLENIIKDKILYFKKKKNENQMILLEKNFFYGKKKEKKLNLSLKSLQICFKDLSHIIKNQEFNFPFALLPLFYYKGFDTFQKLLSQIITFDEDYEKISIDEDSIYTTLNSLKDFEIKNENKDIEENNNINKNNTINKLSVNPIKKLFIQKQEKIEYFYMSTPKKKKQQISIHHPSIIKNVNKKYNIYSFIWTTSTKTFKVTITLPIIYLKFPENKIEIKQYIDFELLFYLYSLNFLFWDFYVVKYLLGFSKLRDYLKELSFLNNKNNDNFFLYEPKSKFYSFSGESLYIIHTDNNFINTIIKIKSFSLIINLSDLINNLEKEYNIHFTFIHLMKLYWIKNHSDKLLFLSKFLDYSNNSNIVNFNYKHLDNFNIKEWIEEMNQFNYNVITDEIKKKSNLETLSNCYQISENKRIRIEYKKSLMTIIKSDLTTRKHYFFAKEIEDELIKKIMNNDYKDLNKLIIKCIEQMNQPITFLTHSNLTTLKKKSYKGIKKRKIQKYLIPKNKNQSILLTKNNNNFMFLLGNNKFNTLNMKKKNTDNVNNNVNNDKNMKKIIKFDLKNNDNKNDEEDEMIIQKDKSNNKNPKKFGLIF